MLEQTEQHSAILLRFSFAVLGIQFVAPPDRLNAPAST